MTPEQFEERLDDLVSEALNARLDLDSIISALELKAMACREESNDD